MKNLTRRDFLKASAAGTLTMMLTSATGILSFATEEGISANAAGLKPIFDGHGNKYEYGHFTIEAIVIDANKEDINPNAVFSLYHIMDYTEAVPYADSYDANGVDHNQNNTSSMYILISGDEALMIDLGNGPTATARHFGEDASDQAVLDKIDQELRDIAASLVEDRNFRIAITHKHGDHVGFSTAFAGQGITVYYPEKDMSDNIAKRFAEYDFQTFTEGEFQIEVGDVTVDTILCQGHTDGSTIYVINTPVITYNASMTQADARYLVMSGDAIGSGSSVWIFSYDGLVQFNGSIDQAVKKLESYKAYDDGLGKGVQNTAELLLLGGHGWQYTNRFGNMRMDLEYARSMQSLIHNLNESWRWQYDGVDGLSLEDWMRKGYICLKSCNTNNGRYTAYFGSTLVSSAAITGPFTAFQQYAGYTE